jgi:N-acetylglucosamine-6-phosphate deacetylase
MIDESKVPPQTRVFNFKNKLAVPGFIDIHLHGGGGIDFSEAPPELIESALKVHLRNGTTSLLPSIMTAPHEQVLKALKNLVSVRNKGKDIPEIIGINLEGPYISKEKSGAQRTHYIRKPSTAEVKDYLLAAEGSIRIMTVAPEAEGAEDFIRFLTEKGIIPSAGHTNASYDQTLRAEESGIRLATHLFNAMRGISHREPGAAGALLLNDDVYTELVADGIHLHPSIIDLVVRVKPIDKVILVTDATKFFGIKKGPAFTIDGKLFGSTTALGVALKNMVQFTGTPFKKVLRTVTLNPAKLLNIQDRKGALKKGSDADIVILDKEFNVKEVFVKGKKVPAN